MQLYRKLFGGMGLILFAFTTLAEPIIKNGNFEISSPNNDFPDRWKTIAKGGCNYIETTDAAGQATRCLEFTLDGKTTRIESSPILQAGRKYRLSADMKTENFKGGGGVYVTPLRWTWGETIRIPAGTTDWKKYTLEFVLNEKQEAAYRLILFANDTSRGKVWFDNVVLEPVATETAQQEAYISAGKMSQAPFLDGNLQDPGWKSTVAASPFVKIGFYDYTAFAYEETSVRVGYDDQHLFFAFNCRQRCLEPARNALDDFRNDVTRHDGEMWKQDCVLMLLKTDAEDSFFEIIVNGAGTITDALCEGPDYWSSGRKVEWESHALAAVKVADGVWSAEVAIPLKQINLEAVQGTDFQVCLGRLNISGNERSSYFPMREGFHTPKFFGKVQFGSALQNLSDIKLGECKTGVNTFSFNGSSEKKDMLGLEIVTMDETAQEVPLRKIFQLSSQPETFPMEYICQGKEFSFMRFSFSNPEGTFLKSPQYSRVNNSQKISLITGEKTQNPVTLNNQPMNRTASGLGSTLHASCEPGLFDLQGLDHPFSLTANGFSLPKRNGGRDCKILIKSTKFWPEHNNQFHIAENSLQPFHVVLHNPYPGLISESYSFNLALPEEFKMVGVSGASHHYPNLPVTRLPDLLQQGKKFQHVQISVPGGLAYKPYYADADGMTLMIELPVSGGKFVRRASEFYAWAEYNGGKVVEAPQTISVDILPPLKGMVPKYFMTQIWGGRIVNLNDKDLMRTFVKKTAITAGFNNLQGGAELVEGTDMTTFAVLNLKTTW
ncbi:MAG: hypothetical protein WCT05_14980, partial [Lentisphaeria bacterium]